MSNLPKKITSIVQAEEVLGVYAENIALSAKWLAEMDKELNGIREKFNVRLTGVNKETMAARALLEDWTKCEVKKLEDRRSIELRYGILGMQLGKQRLELMAKNSWRDVLAKLKGRLARYKRPVVEVNKAAMLADAIAEQPKIKTETLASIGVKVLQDDTFFVKLKQEKKTP